MLMSGDKCSVVWCSQDKECLPASSFPSLCPPSTHYYTVHTHSLRQGGQDENGTHEGTPAILYVAWLYTPHCSTQEIYQMSVHMQLHQGISHMCRLFLDPQDHSQRHQLLVSGTPVAQDA